MTDNPEQKNETKTPAQGQAPTTETVGTVQVTEESLGIGGTFEYEIPQALAFPKGYVDKYPEHDLKWLDQVTREEEGMDYWVPVPHDPKVDKSFPGPNNTVRRGTMFLGLRPKVISAARREKIMERHNEKLKRAKMKQGEASVEVEEALARTGKNTKAHFEFEEERAQKLSEMKEFFQMQKDLGLTDE